MSGLILPSDRSRNIGQENKRELFLSEQPHSWLRLEFTSLHSMTFLWVYWFMQGIWGHPELKGDTSARCTKLRRRGEIQASLFGAAKNKHCVMQVPTQQDPAPPGSLWQQQREYQQHRNISDEPVASTSSLQLLLWKTHGFLKGLFDISSNWHDQTSLFKWKWRWEKEESRTNVIHVIKTLQECVKQHLWAASLLHLPPIWKVGRLGPCVTELTKYLQSHPEKSIREQLFASAGSLPSSVVFKQSWLCLHLHRLNMDVCINYVNVKLQISIKQNQGYTILCKCWLMPYTQEKQRHFSSLLCIFWRGEGRKKGNLEVNSVL